ncbi:MAG: XRE family transcriptional regulator [Actinomycetota bacterium]
MKPRMLQLLRESRGLSQTKLAQLSGIPQPTLSKAEAGLTELDRDRQIAVADALNYPVDVLDWADEVFGFGSAAFHHRKQQSLGVTTLQQIHADVNLIRMRLVRLLRGVELSPLYRFPSFEVEELGSPAEVARAVRATWKLPMGPIDSMMRVLEGAGAIVIRVDLHSHRISAISTSVPGSPQLFILNEGLSADRERFTLAHELGHLVMHDLPTSPDDAEREADAFAAEFLMPANEIRSELSAIDLRKAAALKRKWKTAMSALIRRARDLGKIDDSRYKSLNVQMSRQGWLKQEPVQIPREEPTLVTDVINLHRNEHGYTTEELAALAGLTPAEYRLMFHDEHGPEKLRLIRD